MSSEQGTPAAQSGGAGRPAPGSAGAHPLGIVDLRLTAFRNYAAAHLRVKAGRVVLVGPNGAGKTNLLEAVSLLSPGRGLRGAALGEILPGAHLPESAGDRDGAPSGWAVSARVAMPPPPPPGGAAVAAPPLEAQLGIGLRRMPDGSERRETRIDGVAGRPMAEFADRLPMLWLTPAMDRLFVEGASARRRFLDRLVYGFDPAHARRVVAFEQSMRERNRLLKAGRGDARWFAALEARMAEQAVAVAAARRDGIDRLGLALAEAEGPFPRALVALDGEVESWLDEAPAVAVEDRYRAHLARSRPVDGEAGLTRSGPHRTDLLVHQAESGAPAAGCSTGQQKALLIAIVLANARMVRQARGWGPVLLLDEIAAHLDRVRRAALFAVLAEPGMQTWMTGTDAALFEELAGDVQVLQVQDGQIAAAGTGGDAVS
ncbi:DNA replication/repair protein RecF [Marinibaculum pumilum]|uniref:DNA replication and repair protein RecF n=1 Tax=Marinibaculum pumilum TaxID=1766165 RepID=A0ABV7L862_9PROT